MKWLGTSIMISVHSLRAHQSISQWLYLQWRLAAIDLKCSLSVTLVVQYIRLILGIYLLMLSCHVYHLFQIHLLSDSTKQLKKQCQSCIEYLYQRLHNKICFYLFLWVHGAKEVQWLTPLPAGRLVIKGTLFHWKLLKKMTYSPRIT